MDWQQERIKDIKKKLAKDPVYAAVGDTLKEAMISREVMYVVAAIDHEDSLRLIKITQLFQAACRELLPHVWSE